MTVVSVHWFRLDLRLHDNPALLASIKDCDKFIAVFINDDFTGGLRGAGYNRAQFLTQALNDLNDQIRAVGGYLHILKGQPSEIFRSLHAEVGITRISFEQESEAIWQDRDDAVRQVAAELGIELLEEVSHTLWNPFDVLAANGDTPPLTYDMFLQVTSCLREPDHPVPNPEWDDVLFAEITEHLATRLKLYNGVPTPEQLGYFPEGKEEMQYLGGETHALNLLKRRLSIDEEAFMDSFIPTELINPDLLAPPMSMIPAISIGCLSVRKFYWDIQDVYFKLYGGSSPTINILIAEVIWREFFICSSIHNPNFDKIEGNPVCIPIPWQSNNKLLSAWRDGRTGYPFIDACMRQLRKEGYMHHACRAAVACFLTSGDLFISWEEGQRVFSKYLIDVEWSPCAGSWMLLSSSAFDNQLDSSICCPVNYGRRLDPTGDYIRRYVPELSSLPKDYLFEPWLAPLSIQENNACLLGTDYPHRIIMHKVASKQNNKILSHISQDMSDFEVDYPDPLLHPFFLCLPQSCYHNVL
ncbi:unnamed protein product, partial [Meganyctiphanes norvegica]